MEVAREENEVVIDHNYISSALFSPFIVWKEVVTKLTVNLQILTG